MIARCADPPLSSIARDAGGPGRRQPASSGVTVTLATLFGRSAASSVTITPRKEATMMIFSSPTQLLDNTADNRLAASDRLHSEMLWLLAEAGVSAPEVS